MSVTNVKSRWVNGDLYFYDKSDNVIFYLDGTNRQMVFPSGSAISLPDVVLQAADIALAQGSVLIGNASGAAVALAAEGDGKIIVGNGTTATVVSVSGDVALTNAGVTTVTDLTIASEARGDILRRGASTWERVAAKTSGQILVGDGTDVVSVAVSGDATLSSAGAVAVTDLTIASEARGDLLRRGASAWERVAAATSGQILVGDGTDVVSVAVSGDVTLASSGAVTIANDAVDLAMLGSDTNAWLNAIRSYIADGMLAIGTLAISATAEQFKTTTTEVHRIGGIVYSKVATDGLTFSAADTINTGTAAGDYWGVWLVQINAAGTVSTKSPSADQVYASEAAAIAALPSVDASNVQIGYITVEANTNAAWTANTDDMTPASDCQAANFYDLPAPASLPAVLS